MKKQYTFTIEKEIFEKFDDIAKKNSINKSLFIENSIKNYLNKGWYIVDGDIKENDKDDIN
jgi:predicted transcriptional regulator